MGRIKVTTDIHAGHRKAALPFVTFLFLAAGVLGILLFVKSVNGVEYQAGIVLSAAVVLCCVVWYSYAKHKKLFWVILLVVIAGCCLSVFLLWDVFTAQTAYIVNSLLGMPELEPIQVTETALLLTAILTMLLFVLECLVKSHTALYMFTTMLLLFSPVFGIRTNMETVFLLLLFQMAFWGIQITGKRKNKQLIAGSWSRLAGRSGIVISVSIALTFLIALLLVVSQAEKLYETVYRVNDFMRQRLNITSGRAESLVTGGSISFGNNYPTGAAHLMITAYTQPTETLYLRGFSGGEYIGGDWLRASDEALIEDIAESLEGQEWLDEMNSMFYSMYFDVNANMLMEEPPQANTLLIQHINGKYDNVYVPYYNGRQYDYSSIEMGGYMYQYYEQKDMNIDWQNVWPGFEHQRDQYREMQEAYMEQAKKVYTQVPTELLPRLTALVEENPLTELDEITAFILYTLNSNATYTLTPGWTAFNEDVAEYFLFERGAGFCEHFAVTATLMYRLYGIPARYATGYMVPPSDFKVQMYGNYDMVVTDESAHAWTEIFLEDYGWTPVEVTPASDGSIVASYPGFDSVQMNRIWSDRGWDVTVPSLAKKSAKELLSAGDSERADFLLAMKADREEFGVLLLTLFSCAVLFILLLLLFLNYRRLRMLRKAEAFGCRETFDKLMELVHFGGLMPKYDGSEEDFAGQLAERFACISEDEARRLIAIVNKAAFSSAQPDDSEEAFVRRLYRCTALQIYAGLSWKKKIMYKLIKVFG